MARAGRIPTQRRGGASPVRAWPRRISPPAHPVMSFAHRVAARARPSGSVPRSKRYAASLWRSSLRAVRRTPVRLKYALSSRIDVVAVETSDVAPPITPPSATGPSRSQISRSCDVRVRS